MDELPRVDGDDDRVGCYRITTFSGDREIDTVRASREQMHAVVDEIFERQGFDCIRISWEER